MKFLFILLVSALLLMPAFSSAWQDNSAAYWHDNRAGRGNYDTSGNTSGDGETNLQFYVQMRGSGDTDAYIYGTLGKGWDDVQIHRYDNRAMRSDHMRDYRPAFRESQWPHAPAYYQQPHHEQYPQAYPGRDSGRYSGQYREPYSAPRR